MAVQHKIEFLPNPIQNEFIRAQNRADLFSSRMGEGKSAALCWACAYHTRDNVLAGASRGVKSAIIRDTWENLKDTTLEEFFKWFPPGLGLGTWRAGDKEYHWQAEQLGFVGNVEFLGLDEAKDAAKLQSREFGAFFMDEPAPVEDTGGISETVFDIALSRLRQSGVTWYAAKLATNNPDENHWVYRRFVEPGSEGFAAHQTHAPENTHNLPLGYYEDLTRDWSHRPDLIRRFLEGKYGFQQRGKSVTPEWSDERHLHPGLEPIKDEPLFLLWDFGHNPTCLITQISPEGRWLFLDGATGEDTGAYEFIGDYVRPLLIKRYDDWFRHRRPAGRERAKLIKHIGDPAGNIRDQTSIRNSPVRAIKKEIGGVWRNGAVAPEAGINALRAILRRNTGQMGTVQVDRRRAKNIWHALRGGWHFNVNTVGIMSIDPEKDIHSHPGDCARYGASVLFPLGRLQRRGKPHPQEGVPNYGFGDQSSGPAPGPLGFERPGLILPR